MNGAAWDLRTAEYVAGFLVVFVSLNVLALAPALLAWRRERREARDRGLARG